MKELNKNFDKETRIKLLRVEVRKRENLLRKRLRGSRRYVVATFKLSLYKRLIQKEAEEERSKQN